MGGPARHFDYQCISYYDNNKFLQCGAPDSAAYPSNLFLAKISLRTLPYSRHFENGCRKTLPMEIAMHPHTLLALLPIPLSLVSLTAHSQTWPAKPIRVIVNVGPSAGVDLSTRIVVNGLKDTLGSFIVENRPGADGVIGAMAAKQVKPDGYTLLASGEALINLFALKPNQPFNVFEDFVPVVTLSKIPFYFAVNRESLPAENMGDLIRLARTKGTSLNYVTGPAGSTQHLGMELIKLKTGIAPVRIGYKEIPVGIADLVAGRTQLVFTGYPALAGQMKTGKLKILAVGSAVRSLLQPKVPTLAESGVPGLDISGEITLYAPRGTSAAIVTRINTEINKVLLHDEVKAAFIKIGAIPGGGAQAQIEAKIKQDYEHWVEVVRVSNIKPDD